MFTDFSVYCRLILKMKDEKKFEAKGVLYSRHSPMTPLYYSRTYTHFEHVQQTTTVIYISRNHIKCQSVRFLYVASLASSLYLIRHFGIIAITLIVGKILTAAPSVKINPFNSPFSTKSYNCEIAPHSVNY